MKRVISLYLPHWATDRMRRRLGKSAPPSDLPVILVGKTGSKRIVMSADPAARQLKIVPGMTVAQAQVLVSDLYIEDADPDSDLEALERLALWAYKRYSPAVAADKDGLYIDATGCAHLFGGEMALLADMISRLKVSGIDARVAMAPTYGAAHALARYKRQPPVIVTPQTLPDSLFTLPACALRLPEAILAGLRDLGFDSIGELESQPRAPLALRFGSDIGKRLDQAYGRVSEPVHTTIPDDLLSVQQVFAEPIGTPEQLAYWTGKLAAALCIQLETKQQGARIADLVFLRIDNKQQHIRIGLAQPMRDVKRLTKLLCDKLETVDPGTGVEVITLSAPWIEPLSLRQSTNYLGEAPEPDMTVLIDTLTNRLGPGHLYKWMPVESDIPERSIKKIAPLATVPATDEPIIWPRPSRLFAHPEPIETVALLPDHPPVHFTWRGIRRRVACADGPERIFGEWWKLDAEKQTVRDYFQLEDESGERFWVFRTGDGVQHETGPHTWFIHGIFA